MAMSFQTSDTEQNESDTATDNTVDDDTTPDTPDNAETPGSNQEEIISSPSNLASHPSKPTNQPVSPSSNQHKKVIEDPHLSADAAGNMPKFCAFMVQFVPKDQEIEAISFTPEVTETKEPTSRGRGGGPPRGRGKGRGRGRGRSQATGVVAETKLAVTATISNSAKPIKSTTHLGLVDKSAKAAFSNKEIETIKQSLFNNGVNFETTSADLLYTRSAKVIAGWYKKNRTKLKLDEIVDKGKKQKLAKIEASAASVTSKAAVEETSLKTPSSNADQPSKKRKPSPIASDNLKVLKPTSGSSPATAKTSPSQFRPSFFNRPKAAPSNDPRLYCSFCCEVDEADKLLSCDKCDNSGHQKCLLFSDHLWKHCVSSGTWKCIDCKNCSICERMDDDEHMLFCDWCDAGMHMYCLTPPLEEMPQESWKCPDCKKSKHTQ
eukprot:m.103477 g.103477  ORF g.103477 m.103477 type:complete len:434 (-) comp27501_c1_seq1:442-1743(-)